jgi:hypothetical protein
MRKATLLWILAICMAAIVSSVVTAQVTSQQPPRILTGGDLGFRLEGVDSRGRPTGTLVVKIYNEWVEVGSSTKASPLTTR